MKPLLRATLLAATLAGASACDSGTGPRLPDSITIVSGNNQSAIAGSLLPDSIVARVTNDDGEPMKDVAVVFTPAAGAGYAYPTVDTTDAAGLVRTQWRLGTSTADSQRIDLRVTDPRGGVVTAVSARATALASTGRRFSVVSGNGQSGAPGSRLADSLTVRLVDELGNGVPGVPVTWTVSPYGGTVSPATTTTRADGTARVAWTLGAASGGVSVTASAGPETTVGFGATASSTFTISIQEPRADRLYADSLPVRVTAVSNGAPLARVTARLDGRQVNLSGGVGTLELSGVPEGRKALQVWAVSTAGDSALAVREFTLARAPQLTVVAPVAGSVIRTGSVRIDADCVDPSGCARVAVYASRDDDSPRDSWTLLGESATSFHGTVSLAAQEGTRIALLVEATDGLGARSVSTRWPLYVESTPAWTEVASGGERALDVDATRLLYVESDAGTERVMVRALAGGTATELLAVPAGDFLQKARLFPGGAIIGTDDGVYEWRGTGTAQLASSTDVGEYLSVAGDWATWSIGATLWRRSLSAGTTTVVSTSIRPFEHDVAENGDVAFGDQDGQVYRWRDGVVSPASNGLLGMSPETDGMQVAWISGTSIYVSRGTPVLLSSLSSVSSGRDFRLNGGWVAFVRADAGGVGHVLTLAPDGTQRPVSTGGESRVRAVGPDGTVAFTRPFGRANPTDYVIRAPYTGTAVDAGASGLGELRFIGSELYAFVGRSVFRVSY